MSNLFNEHFRDFIAALHNNAAEYVLVGGMAVILHGYVRGAGNMDNGQIKQKIITQRL